MGGGGSCLIMVGEGLVWMALLAFNDTIKGPGASCTSLAWAQDGVHEEDRTSVIRSLIRSTTASNLPSGYTRAQFKCASGVPPTFSRTTLCRVSKRFVPSGLDVELIH
jgi:hypothetical protein